MFQQIKKLIVKEKKSSLFALNATQFFGVINDNLFKLLLVFLLIETLGKEKAATILSLVGAIYVVPFLLFSSSAGIIADRISKQKMIVIIKIVEVLIMASAMIAFSFKTPWMGYTLLFLLASHSAIFGPPKYGIIPELVSKEKVTKANSLITSCTYLAMILGTFLASFLTEITNKNFVLAAGVCLTFAIFGLTSSLFIEKTKAHGSDKKISPFFITEIYQTIVLCKKIKHLAPSILGSAYFLFIGAFAQLNIIPFAMHSLKLTEIAGGYLFLVIALGIAAGSILCGKYTKRKLELGISCLAGVVLSLTFILLSMFSFSLIATTILLVFLGISGGIFIIPFDSFIQINSPEEKRGQVIAATNFLSFLGVLVASVSLYIFNDLLKMSPAMSFATVGVLTLGFTFLLILRLSTSTLPYLARKLFFRPGSFEFHKHPAANQQRCLYILEEATIWKALLLTLLIPDVHFLLPRRKKRPFWYRLIHSLEEIQQESCTKLLIQKAKEASQKHKCCCLLIKDSLQISLPQRGFKLSTLFSHEKVYCVQIKKEDQAPYQVTMRELY